MDLRQRQQDEIEALKSIYDTFQLIATKPAWKGQTPLLEFKIRLHPHDEDIKDLVGITLHVKLPLSYPNVAAHVSLEDASGLSSQAVKELTQNIQASCKRLVPNEAIYELVEECASYLTSHHNIIQANKPSLNDQLGQRTAQEEELQAARRNAEEQAQKAKAIEEHQMLLKEAALERQKQREQQLQQKRSAPESPLAVSQPLHQTLMPSHIFDNVVLNGQSKKLTVVKGSQIKSLCIGDVYTAEAFDDEYVQYPVSMHCVDLSNAKSYFSSTAGTKRIQNLLEELGKLRSISCKHVNKVYGYTWNPATAQLQVVLEPFGTPLLDILSLTKSLAMDRLVPVLQQILEGLQALHKAGLCWRSWTPERVMLVPSSNDVQLLGPYIQTMVELNRSNPFCELKQPLVLPEGWKSPEEQMDPFVSSKAQDVWLLGVLVVSMLNLDAWFMFSTPLEFVEHVESELLRNMLQGMFKPLKTRDTVQGLLSTIKASCTTPLVPLHRQHQSTIPSSAALISPPIQGKGSTGNPFWQPHNSSGERSRYKAEFEEVEFLGKGGFGRVVKALNKLDRNFYAIKKIRLPNEPEEEQKILREVTTWSRLSHPAIVRYHTAWVESETHSLDAQTALQAITGQMSTTASDSEEEPLDEEDILGLNSLDDTDFLSVHPMTSSYPRIHFGNESDESSRFPSRADSPVVSRADTPTYSGALDSSSLNITPMRQYRTLYIQMEFISGRTLREAIDDGSVTEEAAWRILNQILHAAVHFTSLNIIHRDLKPHNIFLDVDGNVKVGDFGLAVESRAAIDEATHGPRHHQDDTSDMTSGVGTSLYLAPEMARSGSHKLKDRSLLNRIDMYSLGIVFFEMMYPMPTRMERVSIIRNLRLPEIRFPLEWTGSQRQTDLIKALLNHNPAERPAAQEILQSDLLPAPPIDEVVNQVSRLISHPRSAHRQSILKVLFDSDKKENLINDFLFDHGSSVSSALDISLHVAKTKLVHLCEKRGAVEFTTDGPFPVCDLYTSVDSRRPVKLLDQSGIVLQLPYDHTIPLCRIVARNSSLSRLKRYQIGPVYRPRDLYHSGQPRAPIMGSFDIVTTQYTLAAEAECLHLTDAVLDHFRVVEEYVHLLGHSGILRYALQDIPSEHHQNLLRLFEVKSSRNVGVFPKLSEDLSRLPGISAKHIRTLTSLNLSFDLSDPVERHQLERLVSAHPKIRSHVREVESIYNLAKALGINRTIIFSPLLAVNTHLHYLHPSAFFQTSTLLGGSSKKMQTLAVGGRYDAVVNHYIAPESANTLHVTGVSFSMAQLAAAVAEEQEAYTRSQALTRGSEEISPTLSTSRRCDVYVVSFTAGLEKERLEITAQLWKHGIRADLMYENDTLISPEQMVARRRMENVLFLVIVKPTNFLREQTVKVRHTDRPGEEEVSRADLVDYLTSQINEQLRHEAQLTGQREIGTSALESATRATHPTTLQPHQGAIGEIHVLTMQQTDSQGPKRQFNRQKNRNLLADKASVSVETRLAALNDNVPVFVVELDEPAISLMQSPKWLAQDSDVFKKIVDNTPASKRGNLHSLREAVRRHCRENPTRQLVWLYFARIDKSYPLVVQ